MRDSSTMRRTGAAIAATSRPWYLRVLQQGTVDDANPPMPLVASHSRAINPSIGMPPASNDLNTRVPPGSARPILPCACARAQIILARCDGRLILGPSRLHVAVPQQNPTRHAPGVLDALLTQKLSDLQRPSAALAVDGDLVAFVAFEFRGDLLPGGPGKELVLFDDVRDVVLVGLAHIDQHEVRRFLLELGFHLARRDLPIGLERIPGRQSFRVETGPRRLRLSRLFG